METPREITATIPGTTFTSTVWFYESDKPWSPLGWKFPLTPNRGVKLRKILRKWASGREFKGAVFQSEDGRYWSKDELKTLVEGLKGFDGRKPQ